MVDGNTNLNHHLSNIVVVVALVVVVIALDMLGEMRRVRRGVCVCDFQFLDRHQIAARMSFMGDVCTETINKSVKILWLANDFLSLTPSRMLFNLSLSLYLSPSFDLVLFFASFDEFSSRLLRLVVTVPVWFHYMGQIFACRNVAIAFCGHTSSSRFIK